MASLKKALSSNVGIMFLIALFVLLASIYAVTIPFFEAMDEVHHFRRLTEGLQLPVVTEPRWNLAEFHQPPLYYALGAVLSKGLKVIFPHHPFGISQMEMAFYGGRGLSVLFGSLAVLGIYLSAARLFLGRRLLCLGVASLIAFNPSFIHQSSTVTNDSLAAAAGALILLGMIAMIKAGRAVLNWRLYVAVGVLLGIGALTKVNLLPLSLPLLGALAFVSWQQPHRVAYLVKSLALVFGPAFVVSGWWYVRNWVLYGDPVGWSAMALLNPGTVLKSPQPLISYSLLRTIAETFWISFGELGGTRASPFVYLVIWLWLALSFGGLLVLLLRRRVSTDVPDSSARASLALLAVALGVGALLLLRFSQSFVGAHGRYLYPMAGPAAILTALGLTQYRCAVGRWLLPGFIAFLFILAIASPRLYIAPLAVNPEVVSEEALRAEALRAEAQPVDALFDGGARLVGYRLDNPWVMPGGEVRVTLYWQAVSDITTNWTIYVHVLDPEGTLRGQHDAIPLGGHYPTLFWRRGQIWKETRTIPLESEAPPGGYQLEVGLYDYSIWGTSRELHASVTAHGETWAGGLLLGQLRVLGSPIPAAPQYITAISFQDGIQLAGWDWGDSAVTLYWRASETISRSYTVFVHFMDAQGERVAQHDGIPSQGFLPTTFWYPGETAADEHRVIAPRGVYTLQVGLYLLQTGERLKVVDETGTVVDDKAILGTIAVP
ncbi:MAG: phospholipid carrier-dependent glycosyltransferase [Chloroflexi bacterium]|nr:phospholipid carrier-dependent glycosyltransferase [Chloroflexota bacterium]